MSPKLGNIIQPGHAVSAEGPFGSAFLRPQRQYRLVLVASGTGFAPLWAIAEASVRLQPNRPLLLVVGARRLSSLYMIPALQRLAGFPAATLIVTLQEPQTASRYARQGTPIQHLPSLEATDIRLRRRCPRAGGCRGIGRLALRRGILCRSVHRERQIGAPLACSSFAASWHRAKIPPCGLARQTSMKRKGSVAIGLG